MDTENIVCPVDKTLNLINKKWSIQIIRDLFFGKKHFKELKEDKPILSNKVLSNCINELEEKGLIEKKVLNTTPVNRVLSNQIWGVYELAIFTLHDENDQLFTKNS